MIGFSLLFLTIGCFAAYFTLPNATYALYSLICGFVGLVSGILFAVLPDYHVAPKFREYTGGRKKKQVLTPFKLAGLKLKNRIVRMATNEHMHGTELVNFHAEVARGGTAMTTVAYLAVAPDGRTFADQYCLDTSAETNCKDKNSRHTISTMKALTDAVHGFDGMACAQITHAGDFADKACAGGQMMGPSATFNQRDMVKARAMDSNDMDKIEKAFADTAVYAKNEMGFDAVEIHAGHGYLLSQFLSPSVNVRTDNYGGSTENRYRFPVRVIKAVKKAVGPDFPVLVKMNVDDGVADGLTLNDACENAKAFRDAGADALVLSGGLVAKNGLFMLRGNVPFWTMMTTMPQFQQWYMKAIMLLANRLVLKRNTFSESFFEAQSLEILESVGRGMPVMLIGGLMSLESMEKGLGEGFSLVGIARALISQPDLVLRMQKGEWTKSNCTVCNMCLAHQTAAIQCPEKEVLEW